MIDVLRSEDIRALLAECPIGQDLRIFKTVNSTNAVLAASVPEGAPHGSAVIADEQSAGKGRLGRSWSSPPGLNLYTSILLRPDRLPSGGFPLLVYLAGVAVARSVIERASLAPLLKWPNDVWVNRRKLCGILCESIPDHQGRAVVMGIGLNVNAGCGDFPPELKSVATSLKIETGKRFNRCEIIAALYKKIDILYTSFQRDPAEIIKLWKHFASVPRVRYVIETDDGDVLEGKAVDLDEEGALVLQAENGALSRIFSGDVINFSVDGEHAVCR